MGLKGRSRRIAGSPAGSVGAGKLATAPGVRERNLTQVASETGGSGGGGNRTPTSPDSIFAVPPNEPRPRVVTGAEALTPPIHGPTPDHPQTIQGPTRSAPGVPEDPALAVVIALWPALSLEERQRILAIAKRSGVTLRSTDLQGPPEAIGDAQED